MGERMLLGPAGETARCILVLCCMLTVSQAEWSGPKLTELYDHLKDRLELEYPQFEGVQQKFDCTLLTQEHQKTATTHLHTRLKKISHDLRSLTEKMNRFTIHKRININSCSKVEDIDWTQSCIVNSGGGTENHSMAMAKVLANNGQASRNKGQVYVFASLDGDTVIYPSVAISRDDDSILQLRRGALARRPKDVVIVVDTTTAMEERWKQVLVKKAIKDISRTLSPKDRVALMTFPRSERGSFERICSLTGQCKVDQLTFATSERLKTVIEQCFLIQLFKEITSTHYSQNNLHQVFNVFQEGEHLHPFIQPHREKVLVLFLGQSSLNEDQQDSINAGINGGIEGLNHTQVKVVGINSQEGNLKDLFLVSPRRYLNLSKSSERTFIARFHRIFSGLQMVHTASRLNTSHTVISMIHSCKDMHDGTHEKVGLLCVLTPRSFIEQDINLPETMDSYGFIIDSYGEIIYHKHHNPAAWAGHKVRFENVENSPGLLERILSKKVVTKQEKQIVRRWGRTPCHGYHLKNKMADYQCSKIDKTELIFCLVVVRGDCLLDVSTQYNTGSFNYHRLDLMGRSDSCTCHSLNSYCRNPSWVLTKKALLQPSGPFGFQQDKNFVTELVNFMKSGHHEDIRPESRMVYRWVSSRFAGVSWTKVDTFYKWYYAGFQYGVFLIYPGIQVGQQYYDHTQQDWYMGAAAGMKRNQLVFTPPRKDIFGETDEHVVTISTPVLLERRPTQSKPGKDEESPEVDPPHLYGVVAVDLNLQVFKKVTSLVDNSTNAFFMNNVGFLIYHPKFEGEEASLEHLHIMYWEPEIGKQLEENDILQKKYCIDAMTGKLQHWYQVAEVAEKCIPGREICVYWLQNTNLFVVQSLKGKYKNHRRPKGEYKCEGSVNVADKCTGLFNFTEENSLPLCPPEVRLHQQVQPKMNQNVSKQEVCHKEKLSCDPFKTKRFCTGFSDRGCKWCQNETLPNGGDCHHTDCLDREGLIKPTRSPDFPPETNSIPFYIVISLLATVVSTVVVLIVFLLVAYIRHLQRHRRNLPTPEIPLRVSSSETETDGATSSDNYARGTDMGIHTEYWGVPTRRQMSCYSDVSTQPASSVSDIVCLGRRYRERLDGTLVPLTDTDSMLTEPSEAMSTTGESVVY